MKIRYDGQVGVLFVRSAESKIDRYVESEEVEPGIVFDYDAEGKLLAIEFLYARVQLPPETFLDIKAA